jgi:hypothetical protein
VIAVLADAHAGGEEPAKSGANVIHGNDRAEFAAVRTLAVGEAGHGPSMSRRQAR